MVLNWSQLHYLEKAHQAVEITVDCIREVQNLSLALYLSNQRDCCPCKGMRSGNMHQLGASKV